MGEAQVAVNLAEVKTRLREDKEFFIQFYLGHEIHLPVPQFHVDVLSAMVNPEVLKFACAIPRDHAKTTLAKLAAVDSIVFTDNKFTLYLSNTLPIAKPATQDIINFLLTPNSIAVFGEPKFIIDRPNEGYFVFELGGRVKILKAFGAGQQVRGLNVLHARPDLVVVDDLEDTDNIATPELFKKLKRWFYGNLLKATNKFNKKIIWLGNLIEKESMLYEHCHSQFWHSRLYGAILNTGEPLWPDAWSLEALQADYQEYAETGMADVWFAEMMNIPMGGKSSLIQAGEIQYVAPIAPGDATHGFITVDLAISEEKWAHKTTITVHMLIEETATSDVYWQIVWENAYLGIDTIKLFWELVEVAETWQINVIGIEDAAYQKSLQSVYPHLCLLHNVQGLIFRPVPASKRLILRLSAFAGYLKRGYYKLTEGDFRITKQLLSFDPQKKHNEDDSIDGAAQGVYMIDAYITEIMANKERLNSTSLATTIAEFAEV